MDMKQPNTPSTAEADDQQAGSAKVTSPALKAILEQDDLKDFLQRDFRMTDAVERWRDRIDFALAIATQEREDEDLDSDLLGTICVAMIDSVQYGISRDLFRKHDAMDEHWAPGVEDELGNCDSALRETFSHFIRAGMLLERVRAAGWKEHSAADKS